MSSCFWGSEEQMMATTDGKVPHVLWLEGRKPVASTRWKESFSKGDLFIKTVILLAHVKSYCAKKKMPNWETFAR